MATDFSSYGASDEDDGAPEFDPMGPAPIDSVGPSVDQQSSADDGADQLLPADVSPVLGMESDFPLETGEGDAKSLLDLRGFYVGSGAGIFDGATRDGEEARESFYVDLMDYESGEIKRAWGVILGEVMDQAKSVYNLEPGSRIHLKQGGKREIYIDHVNSRSEMEVRKTYANDWICLQDRGPLPSHLSHLMAGINVDQMLDRIALRHDMGLAHPQLAGWKKEQSDILSAIGDDPQSVKAWLSRQASLSNTEEMQLIEAAVDLAGYGKEDAARRKQEIDARTAALSLMDSDRRYDYLMQAAKPHLVAANHDLQKRLADEVVEAIEHLSVMSTPQAHPDSAERAAMRAALAQSVDGLTLQQQMDYLSRRREAVLSRQIAGLVQEEEPKPQEGFNRFAHLDEVQVFRDKPIDAVGLAQEEYRYLLHRRLELGETDEERKEILNDESNSQAMRQDNAAKNFKRIDSLQKQLAAANGDATAIVIGQFVEALSSYACSKVMPAVRTTFEALGGFGPWRKRGAELDLAQLRATFGAAKDSAVYKSFQNDPAIAAVRAGLSADEFIAEHPEAARTEVLQAHLAAQDEAPSPKPDSSMKSKAKGLWKNTLESAQGLADRLKAMAPEDLLKGGKLDKEWISKMQKGLSEFSDDLKKTLMPENVRESMQKMLAEMAASIKLMMELAGEIISRFMPSASMER